MVLSKRVLLMSSSAEAIVIPYGGLSLPQRPFSLEVRCEQVAGILRSSPVG